MTARCQDREHHHLHGRSANADGETGPGAKLAATGLLCSMPAGADNVRKADLDDLPAHQEYLT